MYINKVIEAALQFRAFCHSKSVILLRNLNDFDSNQHFLKNDVCRILDLVVLLHFS